MHQIMTPLSCFNKLETYLDTLNDQLVLVSCDFNTVITSNHTLDKRNGRSDKNKRTSDKVNELIQTFNLCDVSDYLIRNGNYLHGILILTRPYSAD